MWKNQKPKQKSHWGKSSTGNRGRAPYGKSTQWPHISSVTLSLATGCLNSRVRIKGLSAREMWTQRDQYTNEQLPISDMILLQQKHDQRLANHCYRESSKAPNSLVAYGRFLSHVSIFC